MTTAAPDNADEKVSIRRSSSGSMVNVTWVDGEVSVHWQQRVLGPRPATIADAVRACRKQCAMQLEGVALAAGLHSIAAEEIDA